MDSKYYKKYLKYKSKYLNLKKSIGGKSYKYALYGGRFDNFDNNKLITLHQNYDEVFICVYTSKTETNYNNIVKFVDDNNLKNKIYVSKCSANPIQTVIVNFVKTYGWRNEGPVDHFFNSGTDTYNLATAKSLYQYVYDNISNLDYKVFLSSNIGSDNMEPLKNPIQPRIEKDGNNNNAGEED